MIQKPFVKIILSYFNIHKMEKKKKRKGNTKQKDATYCSWKRSNVISTAMVSSGNPLDGHMTKETLATDDAKQDGVVCPYLFRR